MGPSICTWSGSYTRISLSYSKVFLFQVFIQYIFCFTMLGFVICNVMDGNKNWNHVYLGNRVDNVDGGWRYNLIFKEDDHWIDSSTWLVGMGCSFFSKCCAGTIGAKSHQFLMIPLLSYLWSHSKHTNRFWALLDRMTPFYVSTSLMGRCFRYNFPEQEE